MKVILSVPDEGYFERTWWRLLRTWWRLLRTWWRLFQKRVVHTIFDIYVIIIIIVLSQNDSDIEGIVIMW
jgi:hypothetical protein